MKNLIVALCLLAPSASYANPYFRIIDPSHPQPVAGALLDVGDVQKSEAAALLPIVTHSPRDGCMFPTIVCEDWTPLAVGASMNAGQLTLNVAPLANVLPWVYRAASYLVPVNVKIDYLIAHLNDAQPMVTFSAGPVWQYRQSTNKGYFKLFTGLALHF